MLLQGEIQIMRVMKLIMRTLVLCVAMIMFANGMLIAFDSFLPKSKNVSCFFLIGEFFSGVLLLVVALKVFRVLFTQRGPKEHTNENIQDDAFEESGK